MEASAVSLADRRLHTVGAAADVGKARGVDRAGCGPAEPSLIGDLGPPLQDYELWLSAEGFVLLPALRDDADSSQCA